MKKSFTLIASIFLIFSIFIFSKQAIFATDGLIGYWKFDDGTGTTPNDSSGDNVAGSFSATQPTWSTDVPSTDFNNPYSLDFTNTGDRVSIAWPSSLNFAATDQRSFSFWYKPTGDGETASGNFDRIISWTNDGFEIAGTFGNVAVHRLAFYDGSWRDTNFNMTVGTWYNITFTYDGTNVKLYVNNVEKFSGTSGGRTLSGTMYIGARHTGDEGINGRIDDVRVYNRALTPNEVQELSEGGAGPGGPSPIPSPSPTATSSTTTSNTTNSTSCNNSSPASPNLFQITTSPNSATVYFSPVSTSSEYTVSYGAKQDAGEHNITFIHSDKSGAIPHTINNLSQNSKYYFKVQAKNGCMPGSWSQILSETTTQTGSNIQTQPTLATTSRGEIKVVEKQQTTNHQTSTTTEKEATNVNQGDYSLTVKILNKEKPVEGATVELHSTPRKTKTDKDGIARFTSIEKGEHSLRLAYEGYEGEEKVTIDGDQKDIVLNMSIEMTPNANTFISKTATAAISLLLILICFLIYFIWKRNKKTVDKNRRD